MIQVDDNIWICEGETVDFYGFPYPTRSVIVRLADGNLWVWSPIALTESLRQAIDGLGGRVSHLVSPNKIHHLFLADWHKAYPKARLWGPGSTIGKRTDLDFEEPLEDLVPEAWGGEFEQFWFRGSPLMEEIVFFHKSSRTVIFADMTENFSKEFLEKHWSWWQRPLARCAKIVEPFGRAPMEWRWSWFKKERDRASLERLLALNPEKIIMAHGVWQNKDGADFIRRSFQWLL